jgi:hypothetical protein
MLQEPASCIVFLKHGHMRNFGNSVILRGQTVHPPQRRELPVDRRIFRSLRLPEGDISADQRAVDSAGLHSSEESLQVLHAQLSPPQGLSLIDPVIRQVILTEVVKRDFLEVQPPEAALADLCLTLLQKFYGL